MSNRLSYDYGDIVGKHGCVFIKETEPHLYVRPNGRTDKVRKAIFSCGTCNKHFESQIKSIIHPNTISCGCVKNKQGGLTSNTGKRNPIYYQWKNMIKRCYSHKDSNYSNYGGRGIYVCDLWLNSYTEFHSWAISAGYASSLHLDRIDNNKGYNPDNCHYVTPRANANNRRNNIICNLDGEKMSISDVSDKLQINHLVVRSWYHRNSYPPSRPNSLIFLSK